MNNSRINLPVYIDIHIYFNHLIYLWSSSSLESMKYGEHAQVTLDFLHSYIGE